MLGFLRLVRNPVSGVRRPLQASWRMAVRTVWSHLGRSADQRQRVVRGRCYGRNGLRERLHTLPDNGRRRNALRVSVNADNRSKSRLANISALTAQFSFPVGGYVVHGELFAIAQRDLVEHIRHRWAQANLPSNIVFSRVHLPDNPKPLYLVGSWFPGAEEPLIVLTTMVVESLQQARKIIWYYRQRWVCEEASQFLKSRVGLERFRIRRYEAIQRLVILAMIAMGFLTWILLRSQRLVGGYFCFTSRFRKKAEFVYYRLLDGLQEFARLYRLRLGKISLEPLKNG